MADVSVASPSDMDPISQTFCAGNALNAKHFIDKEFQYSNLMFSNAIDAQQDSRAFHSQLRQYSLLSMQRTEALNNALVTKAAQALLDPLPGQLGDAIIGMQGVKAAEATPPQTGQSDQTQILQLLVSLLAAQTVAAKPAA